MLDCVHHDCVGPPLREDALIPEDEPAAEEDSSCCRVLEMFVCLYIVSSATKLEIVLLFNRDYTRVDVPTLNTQPSCF